jgi:formylglycine-generating enzyme required for sulfatase activity
VRTAPTTLIQAHPLTAPPPPPATPDETIGDRWDSRDPATWRPDGPTAAPPTHSSPGPTGAPPRALPPGGQTPSVAPGQRLGAYEIEGELGRGGMGVVYVARDTVLGRRVAIKRMLASSQSMLTRFEREVHALGALQHPNIVTVHEAGQLRGDPYVVLELVEGQSLAHRLRSDGPLPDEEAARLLLDLARAVQYAHRAGFLHRDLKPANVLLDGAGRPKITDFGAARLLDPERERLTRTGDMIGTPAYMPPEQVDGQQDQVDERADVYALGATLYHVLCGQAPFGGDGQSPLNVVHAILTRMPPPPSSLQPQVNPALDAICLRCLAKDRERRYPDCGALAADLERFLAGEDVVAIGAGRSPRPWLLGLAAASLAILLLAGGVVLGLRDLQDESPSESTERVRPGRTEAPPPGPPAWYQRLRLEDRPPLPLPPGLEFSEQPGEYRWARDDSVLVWVPAAEFVMGAGAERAFAGGHYVVERRDARVDHGFFMGKHEVTLSQYDAWCDATARSRPQRSLFLHLAEDASIGVSAERATPGPDERPVLLSDQHPAFDVTWQEAVGYCEWAGLRLPTETEWELAAGGKREQLYPWGDADPTHLRLNAKLLDDPDDYPYTAPVGRFPDGASPVGCLDMAGNVREWLATRMTPADARSPARRADLERDGPTYGRRGGSFAESFPAAFNVSHRDSDLATTRSVQNGFRVALSHPGASE